MALAIQQPWAIMLTTIPSSCFPSSSRQIQANKSGKRVYPQHLPDKSGGWNQLLNTYHGSQTPESSSKSWSSYISSSVWDSMVVQEAGTLPLNSEIRLSPPMPWGLLACCPLCATGSQPPGSTNLGHLGKLPKAGVPDAGDIQKFHLLEGAMKGCG